MTQLTVFVACPYTLFPLDDYKSVFKNVEKSYDIDFFFADQEITNQHILGKILQYIKTSDISLFDITGWNPNVALELGIAVGLERRYFILLNSRPEYTDDVPSDIRGFDRIQYASNAELEAKLIILLKQELPKVKNPSDSAFATLKTRINQALAATAGLNVSKIAETLSEDKALIQSAVRTMVATGELKTRGQKRGTKYYTADTDMRTIPR